MFKYAYIIYGLDLKLQSLLQLFSFVRKILLIIHKKN